MKKTLSHTYRLTERRPLKWPRKFFHVFNGSIGFWLYAFSGLSENKVLLILGGCATFSFCFDGLRLLYPRFNEAVVRFFQPVMRPSESARFTSVTWGLLATWVVLILAPRPVDLFVILVTTYSDTIGGIVGSLWGRHRLNAHATFEGSLAVWLSASVCALWVVSGLMPGLDWSLFAKIAFAFIAGGFAAFAEGLFPKWDDNATLPLIAGPLVWVLYLLIEKL